MKTDSAPARRAGTPDRTDSAVVQATARELDERLGGRVPALAVVLGSGLGGLIERLEDATEVPYADLTAWPLPRVPGHAGRAVAGRLGGTPVLALAGRVHLYEGWRPADVVFPVRVLAAAGVRTLFLTNAAGAIERHFQPGDLMLIRDHLNLTFASPQLGPQMEGEARWPDLYQCWDPGLAAAVRRAAVDAGIPLREGVYAAVLGPSYETPAEIRMLERLGADAVGMSTVPEAIVARARGVRCVGVSCITNLAAGIAREPLSHAEVIATGERVAGRFQRLIADAVERIAPGQERDTGG